jgi:biopolymer transport protein ExbD
VSIAFLCGECGKELHANERAVGRKVRCPDCATLLIVPDPADMEGELEELPGEEQALRPHPEGEGMGELVELEPLEELDVVNEPPRATARPRVRARKKKRGEEGSAPPESAGPHPSPLPEGEGTGTEELPPLVLPGRGHPEDLIDMTAMVDIVFFLLIFFLVTSLQALESVMNMPVPQASEGGVSTGRSMADLENDPNMITVRIEDDDSIWVEDVQVFNDQELALKLRAARQEGPRSLLVIGDADASHGAAVRVFDAGAGAGVNGISLIVQENLQ